MADKQSWWNKIKSMSAEQLEELPNEYIRKFGSFVQKIEEIQKETHTDDNKDVYDMYDKVKNLKKLVTNEQLEKAKEKADYFKNDTTGDLAYQYEKEGYMKRQPRTDLSKHNYNHEQFKEYTTLYEEASRKDKEELRYFYKMVKYARVNVDKGDKSAV